MIKNFILGIIMIILVFVFAEYNKLEKANSELQNITKNYIELKKQLQIIADKEYTPEEYVCSHYSMDVLDILEQEEIVGYMALTSVGEDTHAWVLIGYDPQNNEFMRSGSVGKLVDVCGLNDVNGEPCLIGDYNEIKNVYKQNNN